MFPWVSRLKPIVCWFGRFVRLTAAKISGVASHSMTRLPGPSELVAGDLQRPEIGHRRRHDQQIVVGKLRQNGGLHLLGGFDVDAMDGDRQGEMRPARKWP